MILKLLLLFVLGAIAGWIIEVIRRSYLKHKFVNPGYLKGPYVPLYGFGVLILFFLSSLKIHLFFKIICFAISTTILELIVGLIFVIHFKIKLWDYSTNKFNYKGIICLRNSIYWTILSTLFYLLIYPLLKNILTNLTSHLVIIYLIGLFYGLVLFDFSGIIKRWYQIRSFVRAFNKKYHKNINITYAMFRKYVPKIDKFVKEKLTKELLLIIKKKKTFLIKEQKLKKTKKQTT